MSDNRKTSVKLPNYSEQPGGIRVRVMCPACGTGGAHPISMPQPKCHICDYKVFMQPANNTRIVCTWKYAKDNLCQQ